MNIKAHTTSGVRAASYAKFASLDGPLNLTHPRVGLVESCGRRVSLLENSFTCRLVSSVSDTQKKVSGQFDLRRKHLACLHSLRGSRSVLSALDARDRASSCFSRAHRLIFYL